MARRPVAQRISAHDLTLIIRNRIIAGEFAPGLRLTEEELAEAHGVSRIPIREALRVLESEGFLRVQPYYGTFVAELTPQEAADLLEIRGVLEPLAAFRAATRRTDEQLRTLDAIIARGNAAIADGDLGVLPELNTEFHQVMIEASGNTSLNQLIAQLRHKIAWVYSVELPRRAADSWAEHRLLVGALERRDGETARAVMVAHIRAAEAAYRLRNT